MRKWNLIVDVAKCHNCNNCVLATKDEYIENEFPGYTAPQPRHGHNWLRIRRQVRGTSPLVDVAYLPSMCNHCDDAPCIKAAGDGSVRKRADGIVIFDPKATKGRRDLVRSCPYGEISWNEELQLPQTWIFDAHLLDAGWPEPRCVQACPTGALRSVKVTDAEMRDLIEKEDLSELQPKLGTKPRVHYKNLHRFRQCFIGGTVVHDAAGNRDCAEGAVVKLLKAGSVVETSSTDRFGEFKFDRLDRDSGTYAVQVSHPSLGSASAEATLGPSTYLGVLVLNQPRKVGMGTSEVPEVAAKI